MWQVKFGISAAIGVMQERARAWDMERAAMKEKMEIVEKDLENSKKPPKKKKDMV